jgi:hypothetical protein
VVTTVSPITELSNTSTLEEVIEDVVAELFVSCDVEVELIESILLVSSLNITLEDVSTLEEVAKDVSEVVTDAWDVNVNVVDPKLLVASLGLKFGDTSTFEAKVELLSVTGEGIKAEVVVEAESRDEAINKVLTLEVWELNNVLRELAGSLYVDVEVPEPEVLGTPLLWTLEESTILEVQV